MPMFRYKAATPGGEVLQGEMEAPDDAAVIRRLQADGNIPIRAEPMRAATQAVTSRQVTMPFSRRGVSRREVELLTVELSTLLDAGLSLDRALGIMAELASREQLRELLEELHTEVRGGADLSAALAAHERLFPRFYRAMIRAGEAGGDIGGATKRLGEFMERASALRESMISALVYPIILVCVAVLSITVILGVVVPRISAMFADAGAELPLSTRIVVSMGGVVEQYWWVGVIVGIGVWLLAKQAMGDPAKRLHVDRILTRLPLAGGLVGKLEAARFTRALGTLIGNGVTLIDALAISREVVGNTHIARALVAVSDEAESGQGLSKPLIKAAVFPRLAGHLVRIGEEAGNLEAMLMRLAEIYDVEVNATVQRLVALLGPILILGMGVMIAGLILSILAALLSINELAF